MNNENITARHVLRTQTRDEHDRVDAVFGSFDLRDREQYAAFLLAQAEAFLPVERAIDAANAEELIKDWPLRRRSEALRADLAALGIRELPMGQEPEFTSPPQLLGAIYVLEGSRLGGRMLARGLPDGFPHAFLDGADSAMWRSLIDALDKLLKSEAQIDLAVISAKDVFARFEIGARRHAKDVKLV